MLTEIKPTYHEYGYGDNLYKNWISYINNDDNYQSKKDSESYISPEWCDMAERRAWTAEFFLEAEAYVGQGKLKKAYESFYEIHTYMNIIRHMVLSENKGKLLERTTRDKIISLLNTCRKLDHTAADNIRQFLDDL
jgi:hypothetical protein